MGNALGEHYETLHAAKHRMSAQRKKLQVRRSVSFNRLCRRVDGIPTGGDIASQGAISQDSGEKRGGIGSSDEDGCRVG
jgi:hypothetical protein